MIPPTVDWEDFRVDIIRICTRFSDIEEFRNKLKVKIECLVNEKSNDDHNKYESERMLLILFDIVDKYESKECCEL